MTPFRDRFVPVPVLALLFVAAVAVPAAAEDATAGRVQEGREAPPVMLEGSGDESYDLAALRGEKKAVLVFFRGSW